MLAVFYGNDQIAVRQKAHQYIDSIIQTEQGIVRIEADKYEDGQLFNLGSATVLFGLSPIYLIDTLSANADSYKELLAVVEDLGTSTNTFVIIEKDLLANDKKIFAKHTDKVNEYKKLATKGFNPFTMAEALARRDKKLLWVLLQEAKANNLSAEEIIGILWWQLKTLRLAKLTKSAEEAGVKDFPYSKAKQALRNYKEGEVEEISRKLLKLYHEAHGGLCDMDNSLEEWVLRM